MKSASLFKVTVFVLTVPAVLLLALTILIALVTAVTRQSGIGSFAYALTRWELTIAIAMGVVAIIFFFVLALAFFRPHKRQKKAVNR